jgi:uncharacterized protein (DUF169 family)
MGVSHAEAPMTPYAQTEQLLAQSLNLARRPIAIAFRDSPPSGVSAFEGTAPSSCSFWRLAAASAPFFTRQTDHYNCPIGSYTHNIPLPSDRAPELEQTLGLMSDLGYLRMEEVPGIPRVATTPEVVVYAGLGDMPIVADVVVMSGTPAQMMLLQEAALRAGSAANAPLMGRPTCMAVPAAMATGMATSLGCIGNRVYTDVPDDECYVTVSGQDVARVAEQLATIVAANRALADHHRARKSALATPTSP